MPTTQQSTGRWRTLGIKAWASIGVLILVAVGLWVLGRIAGALVPFLMAFVIVFLLRGPVARLERRGMPRGLAVLVSYVVAAIVIGVAAIYIIPALADQLSQFVGAFPTYYAQAARWVADMTARYWTNSPAWFKQGAAGAESTAVSEFGAWARSLAGDIVAAGGSLVTFVVDGLLAVFVAGYLLADLPTIQREVMLVAGPRWRPELSVVMHEISTVVGGFLRGQLIIAFANGTLTALGLWVLGMPYSGVIGLITGTLSVIPYIGPLVGGGIVIVTGLFVSPWLALWGVLWMVAVQQIEGTVLSPRIMSQEVDLHPALVIFSLLSGAELGGLVGMLVAIPVAATGKALFVHYFEKHTHADITHEDGALFRESKPKTRARRASRTGPGESASTTDEE